MKLQEAAEYIRTTFPPQTTNWEGEAFKLHTAICQAVTLMNVSVGVASDVDAIQAHNILRQALMDYRST